MKAIGVANQKVPFDDIIETRIGSPLIFGNSYYVRAVAKNAAGSSDWSSSVVRILLKQPTAARNASFTANGALAFNISWNPPHDLGAGPGTAYPLVGYQVSLMTSHSSGNRTFQISGEDTTFGISNLIKGARYFVSVRARSGAISSPAEQDWGYGPSGEALAQCIDGEIRWSVCGGFQGARRKTQAMGLKRILSFPMRFSSQQMETCPKLRLLLCLALSFNILPSIFLWENQDLCA